MPLALRVAKKQSVAALLLVLGAATVRPPSRLMASSDAGAASRAARQGTLKPAAVASPDIPFSDYDGRAEQTLLDLANQVRAKAGAPLLRMDEGLCQAARAHGQAMLAAHQLSHRLDGEAALPQRLANATDILLDQEGENVALDLNAKDGHRHLMLSAPHRANLLSPAYNVVGMGVVRYGDYIYIVQDFGHALPNYSAAEVKDRIAATVTQARHQAKQPDLARRDLANADDAACSMAQADKLSTSPIHELAQRYTVLSYTSLYPETLPANAGKTVSARNLRSFSVGACYSRTETYPTGVYWVVLTVE